MNTEKELRDRVLTLEQELADQKQWSRRRSVRKRSEILLAGVPLYEIAVGPDPKRDESRGHARAIVAIGDIATGVLAIGGVARGLVAIGGVAMGAICLGGVSLGMLFGAGGLATGLFALGGLAVGVVALGGGAIGVVAVGGGAIGYYACGGGALGKYVISGLQQDPEAIRLFSRWVPGFDQWLRLP